MEAPKPPPPPKPFCIIFVLAVISFFLILIHSIFVLVFIGLIIAGFLYISAMVCIHRDDTYSASSLDKEKFRETTLLEKIDGLHTSFPKVCPECGSAIEMNQVHIVDELTIMCPNCLTVIKGVLNE